MTPEKIISLIERYEAELQRAGIPKLRMDIDRTFGSLSTEENLLHAHHLCEGVKQYARNPLLLRKTGSHLTSVQMCLSNAHWYTLRDLMNHNKP